MTNQPSETPRTDAAFQQAIKKYGDWTAAALTECSVFARTLERELAEVKKERDEFKSYNRAIVNFDLVQQIKDLDQERDALQAKVKELQSLYDDRMRYYYDFQEKFKQGHTWTAEELRRIYFDPERNEQHTTDQHFQRLAYAINEKNK